VNEIVDDGAMFVDFRDAYGVGATDCRRNVAQQAPQSSKSQQWHKATRENDVSDVPPPPNGELVLVLPPNKEPPVLLFEPNMLVPVFALEPKPVVAAN
jgi:hypothetical protein